MTVAAAAATVLSVGGRDVTPRAALGGRGSGGAGSAGWTAYPSSGRAARGLPMCVLQSTIMTAFRSRSRAGRGRVGGRGTSYPFPYGRQRRHRDLARAPRLRKPGRGLLLLTYFLPPEFGVDEGVEFAAVQYGFDVVRFDVRPVVFDAAVVQHVGADLGAEADGLGIADDRWFPRVWPLHASICS